MERENVLSATLKRKGWVQKMEDIINRLSEIEHTAADIAGHAADEKSRLNAELEQKQKLLDAEITEQTAAKLDALTQHLEESKAQAINDLRTETDALLVSLEKDFEENHTTYARELFARITEA